MPDYIKQGSDRPDLDITLQDEHGSSVDLRDATGVQIQVWVDNTKIVDAPATIEVPRMGIVTYDFSRGEVDTPGDALVEFRVDWDDGDEQWFPIAERGYELRIVEPPGPRGTQPQHGHDILVISDTETHVVDGAEVYTRVENGGEMHAGPSDEVQL